MSIARCTFGECSRRAILGGVLGVTMGSMVGGRSGNAQTPVAGPFPRTVVHASGTTIVPAPPQRIVVTNENEGLDSLLALGVRPVLFAVGGGYGEGLAPWAVAAGADEIPSYVAADIFMPDPEKMAAADPDVILGTWLEPESFDLLSQIAPTINLKYDEAVTWDEVQRLVGVVTGRDTEADAAIAATEEVMATAKADLANLTGATIAVAYVWGDSFLVNGEHAPLGRVLADFGLSVDSPQATPPGSIATLSLEAMNEVAEAEILLSLAFDPVAIAAQEASPIFRTLPAVRNGRYLALSPEMAQAFYLESSLSLRWAVPQLVDAVQQAASGEGTRLN